MNRSRVKSIAKELKNKLIEMYGQQLVGLLLFGSYARGDATDESDIDMFVLLKKVENPFRERQKFARIIWELSLENDVVISALPIEYAQFQRNDLPVFSNAREEGLMV